MPSEFVKKEETHEEKNVCVAFCLLLICGERPLTCPFEVHSLGNLRMILSRAARTQDHLVRPK